MRAVEVGAAALIVLLARGGTTLPAALLVLGYVVLAVSFALESVSLLQSVRQIKREADQEIKALPAKK